MILGKIHSIQTLGTLDGPGVRFVVFVQGCPLRCHCCHNPDTWDFVGGQEYTPDQILEKVKRYREYFGEKGGITISGGEPLCQPDFVYELFRLCKDNGINTCLDTSGCVINKDVKKLLGVTDRVLLDIKYTDDESYKNYVGCSYSSVISFLELLDNMSINTTLRQVIIPTKNDDEENIRRLKDIKERFSCVDSVELLPFKKICSTKYEAMQIDFPFLYIDEPGIEKMAELKKLL